MRRYLLGEVSIVRSMSQCFEPQGAFYVPVDRVHRSVGDEFCERLLHEQVTRSFRAAPSARAARSCAYFVSYSMNHLRELAAGCVVFYRTLQAEK